MWATTVPSSSSTAEMKSGSYGRRESSKSGCLQGAYGGEKGQNLIFELNCCGCVLTFTNALKIIDKNVDLLVQEIFKGPLVAMYSLY